MINYATIDDFDEMIIELGKLACVSIIGDWHQHLLIKANSVGLPDDSAPTKSIIAARERNGIEFHVTIRLANNFILTGSVGRTGLLVSNKEFPHDLLIGDAHVAELLSFFEAHSTGVSVDLG